MYIYIYIGPPVAAGSAPDGDNHPPRAILRMVVSSISAVFRFAFFTVLALRLVCSISCFPFCRF